MSPAILLRICALSVVAAAMIVPARAETLEMGKPVQPALSSTARADVAAPISVQPGKRTCSAPTDITQIDRGLVRTARRIIGGESLTIVAIGSSSTAGAGASTPAKSYPSRLEAILKDCFPDLVVKVINRGANGEETQDMLARFDAAVIAEKPDLVLWQVGTNAVLRDREVSLSTPLIREGLMRLKAIDADVVLIDPQFAPKVNVKPDAPEMVRLVGDAAREGRVGLFRRYAIMRYWNETAHVPFEDFISDGLHMNDWSYDCIARLLSNAIADAATRSIMSAQAPGLRR